jgi:dUTPase
VSKTIPARGKALVDTQLSIAVPEGTYGRVAPRSGLGTWWKGIFNFSLLCN